MDQQCPKCRMISPATAARCDCGWDFATGQLSAEAARQQLDDATTQAWASWICPAIAWASQVVLALTLNGVRGLGLFWLVAAGIQGVLILIGLYFGLKVLAMGRASVPRRLWRAAIVGVAMSGGTILLIVGLSVFRGM